MDAIDPTPADTLEAVLEADARARTLVNGFLDQTAKITVNMAREVSGT